VSELDPGIRTWPSERRSSSRGWALGGAAIVALLLASGLLVWLLAYRDDGSATSPASPRASAVTQVELRQLAADIGHPLYWAGPNETDTYELTRTRDGGVYLRYLPDGASVGDPRPNFRTIGTYPSTTAFATLQAGARRKDARVFRFESGAIAVSYAKTPGSVFFAFPGSPYLVEVFDPEPGRAVKLVTSGQVETIG
jgi:hypothetical protein